jgi:predicted ATPase with chaperone activity
MDIPTIPTPNSVEQLGLHRNLLDDLALKILYLEGELNLSELAARMRVSQMVVHEIFQSLRDGLLCEAKGMSEGTYVIVPTSGGRTRALELLAQNQYAGPAPVSLSDYVKRVRTQTIRKSQVNQLEVDRAFAHLVLSPQILWQLGTALVSGTSVFLHGPTGTGKSSIAESMANAYHDQVLIPYAVEVEGQIITLYDPLVHRALERPREEAGDERWVRCRRPCVTVGGELTIDMLNLQINPVSKFYSAPVQMAANNGVLIVDDFGRQRIWPEELLNRWTVPLDRHVDYLTLVGGSKIEVPFDLFVVFATNLDPARLADEAFLRRIRNKIRVDCVDREQFHEIFRRLCCEFNINYDGGVVDDLIDLLGSRFKQPLRPCYPLDIVRQICWDAQYGGRVPKLEDEAIARACHNYFGPPTAG